MTSPIIGCRWGFAPERETLSEAVKREAAVSTRAQALYKGVLIGIYKLFGGA